MTILNLQARTAIGLAMLLGTVVHVQTTADRIADLSQVPQVHETKAQRDTRMQWFRDAKFGMFIHWGPCSVGQKEIGWGREANRPWDINKHGPRTSDPAYDSNYKQFNPSNYNADAWVQCAKDSGLKYMVLIMSVGFQSPANRADRAGRGFRWARGVEQGPVTGAFSRKG